MRIRPPNRAQLRVATLAILVVMCTLLILSAVFPFPEATISSLLSIGLGTGKYASAQPVSTNGMAYAQVNKSGCCVRKGNCQIRLDFYLEPEDARYYDKYLYLVDTDSPEYLAGYPGEVDKDGSPVDQADWDKWWEGLPRVWQNTPFHTHFVYLPADFTEEDIKAQIDIHLGNFYQAFQDGWDAVPGGMRHGWDVKTRIRPTDYSKIETPVEYDARIAACEAAISSLTEFQHKPDGEIQGETFPATEIDIGDAAVEGNINWPGSGWTAINVGNPANDTGTIDYIERYYQSTHTGVKVGTFTGSGTSYANNDYYLWGVVGAGSPATASGLDIDVTSGDFIGEYAVGTARRASTTGGSGLYYKNGDQFDAGTQTYSLIGNYKMSLYGTGETAGGEPSISNTPSSNAFGVLEVGSQATTGFEYFTITNNGTVTVDVTIQGTNATGGDDTWILSDTATPSENTFGLIASTDSKTLYQNYPSGHDGSIGIYDYYWGAQTFTPSTNHTVTSVELQLYRHGSPGNVTVSIRDTSGGQPTGEDLCSGTTNGDTLTDSSAGEWREIVFDTNTYLTASTQYAIVVRALSGDWENSLEWLGDASSPTYGGGTQVRSEDYGEEWTTFSAADCMFKEYGGHFDIIVKRTATYNTLVSGLVAEDTQGWGLLISMPTALSGYDNNQMSATITLVASAAS